MQHYSYLYPNLYVFGYQVGRKNVFEVEDNKHFPNSIPSQMHLIVRVVPNYVKFVTFSNNLLPNFMCNFVLDSVDKTNAQVFTSLSSYCRWTVVRADKEVFVFFFTQVSFALNKQPPPV
jgi:hypothetical protein